MIIVIVASCAVGANASKAGETGDVIYLYTLVQDDTKESYDMATAAACLQGIINRDGPKLYILPTRYDRPQYWLDILSSDGRWLEGWERVTLPDMDALIELAGDKLKGAIIWDPDVPATVNVAVTAAGVEDGVVLSPELAETWLARWKIPVLKDFRGMFTGSESGSAKNDAYRWAIREYLASGRCSTKLLCLFEDAYSRREIGDISYVVTRDWAGEEPFVRIRPLALGRRGAR